MKNSAVLFLSAIISVATACTDLGDDTVMCTEDYRMLTVTVSDPNGAPFLLDSSFVKKTATGEVIRFEAEDPYMDSVLRLEGRYLLMTDGKMGLTSGTGTEFTFHGFKSGMGLISESYVIANDRCHVLKLSGRDTVVVN